MTTNSAIQLISEGLAAKTSFFGHVSELLERYEVCDAILCCGEKGRIQQPSEGYFGQTKTYETLAEAQKNFNIYTQGIRINEHGFHVGNLHSKISEVSEEICIDLKNMTIVNG